MELRGDSTRTVNSGDWIPAQLGLQPVGLGNHQPQLSAFACRMVRALLF